MTDIVLSHVLFITVSNGIFSGMFNILACFSSVKLYEIF